MNFLEVVKACRSYRRFYQDHQISRQTLEGLVDLGRLAASGKNLQPLKYFLSNTKECNSFVFECLKWAGYLPEWGGPREGERPSAYIVVVHDKNISKEIYIDHGFAIQNILLGATVQGLGGCVIASINKRKLIEHSKIAEHLEPLVVVALGKPKEDVRLVVIENNQHKYYRDDQQIHYVPKRTLSEIILN